MGGGAGAETTKKALRATASDGDGASVPPVEQGQQQQQPAPLPAGGGADGSAAVQSCGQDEQDDEQVERFYALLANIRGLRGFYSAGTGTGPGASGRGSKRAREAEAPWTPAFRLEDFEEEVNQGAAAADARRCAVMNVNQGASGGVARRPAAARARGAVAAADDDGHEEDQVERGGNKLRHRVAARG